ncbi:hypothetical protein [Trueperella bialowiezensis]|uniref:Uncharacterized protein n=1 Tax=Trueperella bialowiezensis TaxID=312285 RepID=A0A448PF62_9ACTO|nr:hypothetical protein [Trueperella bialowiezensis]VEI13524.1 Uncharacterised protein [Trueperella bialowiezensis]
MLKFLRNLFKPESPAPVGWAKPFNVVSVNKIYAQDGNAVIHEIVTFDVVAYCHDVAPYRTRLKLKGKPGELLKSSGRPAIKEWPIQRVRPDVGDLMTGSKKTPKPANFGTADHTRIGTFKSVYRK